MATRRVYPRAHKERLNRAHLSSWVVDAMPRFTGRLEIMEVAMHAVLASRAPVRTWVRREHRPSTAQLELIVPNMNYFKLGSVHWQFFPTQIAKCLSPVGGFGQID